MWIVRFRQSCCSVEGAVAFLQSIIRTTNLLVKCCTPRGGDILDWNCSEVAPLPQVCWDAKIIVWMDNVNCHDSNNIILFYALARSTPVKCVYSLLTLLHQCQFRSHESVSMTCISVIFHFCQSFATCLASKVFVLESIHFWCPVRFVSFRRTGYVEKWTGT